MLSDTSSVDSDGAKSTIVAPSFAPDLPAASRKNRSRLVRIGSATPSIDSTPVVAANNVSSRSSSVELPRQPSVLLSSPLSGPLHEAASVVTPSLLLPPSRGAAERTAASLRGQQQQQHRPSRKTEEEQAFLDALAGLKAPQATTVTMINCTAPRGESRGTSPEPRKSHGRNVSQTDRAQASQTLSPFAMAANGSRPSSALSLVGGHGATVSGANAATTSAAAALGSTMIGKRSSEVARRTTSIAQNVAAPSASMAALFPTSEWIRAALSNMATIEQGKKASVAGDTVGLEERQEKGGAESRAGATAKQSPSRKTSLMVPSGGSPAAAASRPPQRDTAMRLHEQRVKAAMRSQDEMRDFSAVLRRLEEDGAQVLWEQRRRRQERHASQRGSILGSRSRRRVRTARHRTAAVAAGGGALSDPDVSQRRLSANSESGVQSSKGDDDVSEGFSDYTDVNEEETMGEEGGGTAGANPNSARGDRSGGAGARLGGGGSGGASARAVAEVHAAENMSRVALYKLRDRTAREWVVLQRRRLEQRRSGPAALHRHMHASTLRLQTTRSTGEVKQLVNGSSTGGNSTPGIRSAVAVSTTPKTQARTAGSTFPPCVEEAGPSLQPVVGGPLTISWGEANTLAAPTDASTSLRGESVPCCGTSAGAVERLPRDDAGSLLSAGTGAAQHASSSRPGENDASHAAASTDSASGGSTDVSIGSLRVHEQKEVTAAAGATANASLQEMPKEAATSLSVVTPLHVASPRALTRPHSARAFSGGEDAAVASPLCATSGRIINTTTTNSAAAGNARVEDEELRRELQRLLFQANECTMYGLDQCLNSRARTRAAVTTTKTQKQRQQSVQAAKHTTTKPSSHKSQDKSGSAAKRGPTQETGVVQRSSPPSLPPPPPPQPIPIWTPPPTRLAAHRLGSSLPVPLHRQFNHLSAGTGGSSANSISGSAGSGQAAGRPRATSHTETAEALQRPTQAHVAAANELALTPTKTPSLPPLGVPPATAPLSDRRVTSVNVASPSSRSNEARSAAAKQSGTSLPSVHASSAQVTGAVGYGHQAASQPPRRFASLSSRKRHQRTPLPVERGVGEHAAALLQHEILLTRRYEMEAERGNAREIERACETLQQLLPLRKQLLDQEISRSSPTTKALSSAQSLLLPPPPRLQASAPALACAPPPAAAVSGGRPGQVDGVVDRSYHPQAVLQRHRQLLYDEGVRLESSSRAAARNAYLDVLVQLAQRHISSISWPVVAAMLAEARAQLCAEADESSNASGVAASTCGSDGDGEEVGQGSSLSRSSPGRPAVPLLPRDKLQQLIATHLGVLELSQWPVQEVLQHLAALYRVPLHLLHEGIAEQQRRFAHTYNYEERFRAVDRKLVGGGGGGGGADSVLRLTLQYCRRPPLAPARDEPTTASLAPAAGQSDASADTSAVAAAAAHVMGVPPVPPHGQALYYIRLRVGHQSTSSSAVPLSSSGRGGSAASAGRYNASGRDGKDDAAGTMASGAGALTPSTASTKVLSFMGQTLTVYLPTLNTAARRRRKASAFGGSRLHPRMSTQQAALHSGDGADGEEENEGYVVLVELMQTGVEAPLARGEVDLEAMGMNTYGESGRMHTQTLQIPLKRKGYRTAELKVALEVTS